MLPVLQKDDDGEVLIDGVATTIPRVPQKYLKWLRNRRSIYREISNMAHLGDHPNVIKLHEVWRAFAVLRRATRGVNRSSSRRRP